MRSIDTEADGQEATTTDRAPEREHPFTMSTTGTSTTKTTAAHGYDQLLSAAQAAQAAADRAVADLAAVKRTMAEAPRVLQVRRDELARAQAALSAAENDYLAARDQVTARQNEAARLIEAAADAQRALAQALITQDVPVPPAALESLSSRLASATAHAQPQTAGPVFTPPSDATLGRNRYTPTPAMHPADLHYEVVEYLRERDALCPSCGHSLRAIQSARCPGCKLQLSLKVLHSVRAKAWAAPTSIWIVRALCAFACLMSAYLAFVVFTGGRAAGCGGGSACDLILRSGWSRLLGLPVSLFAIPLFGAIFVTSFFTRVGLTDSTRQRAWSIQTFLACTVGLTALWFIAAQLVVFKSLCPHCVLVHAAGLAVAAILLLKTPLRKAEDLPEPAIGRISVPKRSALAAIVTALVISVGFAALHGSLSSAKGPIDRNKILGIPDKSATPDNGGLLMKGLEGVTPNTPPPTNESPAPETPRKEDAGSSAPKPEATKPSAISEPTPTPVVTPTDTSTPAAVKVEEPKQDGPPPALLLPGLDLPTSRTPEKK